MLLFVYKSINTYFPKLFFFLPYILMSVPFAILLIQKNKPITCLFKTIITLSCLFIFSVIYSNLFKIFTAYKPNHYNTIYDVIIGLLIVVSSILFNVFYRKKIAYKFSLSAKNQLLIIIEICFFILFFMVIYPLVMNTGSAKLYALGGLIFTVIVITFIKTVVYIFKLEKVKEMSKNEFKIALNLKNKANKQQDFIIETTHYYKSLLANIGYFISIKDYEALENYYNEKLIKGFKEILNELESENYILEALNSINDNQNIIKSLLYQYYVKAKSLKDVYFRLDINFYIKSFCVDEDDLFKILNIILSNAIEELESIDLKIRNNLFAHLFIFIEKDDYMIKFIISNTINPVENNKPDHYGEGIKIARKLEKLYKGKLDISLIPQQKIYKSIIEIRL